MRVEMPVQWRKIIHDISKDGIMRQSQRECPVDTGALRSTGKVHSPTIGKAGHLAKIALTYGGMSPVTGQFVQYAVIQHEFFKDKKKEKNLDAKWKYLEDPVNQHRPVILSSLRAITLATTKRIFAI